MTSASFPRRKIGVNVRALATTLTGIGRYTHELLKRMAAVGHEWHLYSHRPLVVDDLGSFPNIHVKARRLPRRFVSAIWHQTLLPWEAARDGVDLFWSPTPRLPLLLPRRIPTVVTVHDLVWKHAGDTMKPFMRRVERREMGVAARHATSIIAVSHNTERELLEEYPHAARKTRVIGEGTVLPRMTGDAAARIAGFGLSSATPYVLFVGTCEPRKNLRRLVRAFARLPEELRARFLLVVAGRPGWGGVDPAEDARQAGIGGRVKVLGYVTESELDALYRDAWCLAMPSVYEGFGLPLIEAMSRGVPVLTSDQASMPEVAGPAAVYVNPFSEESITRGLAEMLSAPGRRGELAGLAAGQAARFDWGESARQTLEVFEEAIRRNSDMRKPR